MIVDHCLPMNPAALRPYMISTRHPISGGSATTPYEPAPLLGGTFAVAALEVMPYTLHMLESWSFAVTLASESPPRLIGLPQHLYTAGASEPGGAPSDPPYGWEFTLGVEEEAAAAAYGSARLRSQIYGPNFSRIFLANPSGKDTSRITVRLGGLMQGYITTLAEDGTANPPGVPSDVPFGFGTVSFTAQMYEIRDRKILDDFFRMADSQ